MPNYMKPAPMAIETGEMKQKKYVREEGARASDMPSPEKMEQIKREMEYQRMDRAEQRAAEAAPTTRRMMGQKFAKGGKVGSASARGDGIAKRGKTKCKIV